MRKVTRILDSYSLIAYFEGETGKEKMIDVLRSARDSNLPALLSVVNWGEVFYIHLREMGREHAERTLNHIATLPIHITPVDKEMAKQAAEFKASKKMSYANCFAAALAKLHKAELVTGDREFRQVEDEVKILWL